MNVPVSAAGAQVISTDPQKRAELLAAAQSFAVFLRYWNFRDPDSGEIMQLGDRLWRGQRQFVATAMDDPWVYALKARKLGFTTIECAYDGWCARFRDPNGRVHLFSRRDAAAMDLLERVKFGLDRLPDWMKLPYGTTTTHVLELQAGPDDLRHIEAYPSNEETAVEQSCTHAHVDEWWRMGNPRKVWQAIEPTITRSCHIITTGLGNVGYPADLWRQAVGGGHRFKAFFVDALARDDRDQNWLESKKSELPELLLKHEYPLRWEDALAAGTDFVFKPEDLDYAATDAAGPTNPVPGRLYVHAWDIGRHKDAAVGIVLDVTEAVHDVVWYGRFREKTYPVLQTLIEQVHRSYGGLTVVEDNAAGEAVRENLDLPEDEVEGWKTTGASKPRAISNLQLSFENQTLRYDPIKWPQLDAELRAYQWADQALVQDSVITLAIGESYAGEAFKSRRKRRARVLKVVRTA